MQVMAKLNKLPGVKAIPRDEKLKEKHAHSRIWNETWLSAFFHKPCNHELFVLQSLNMEGMYQILIHAHFLMWKCQSEQGVETCSQRSAEKPVCFFRQGNYVSNVSWAKSSK